LFCHIGITSADLSTSHVDKHWLQRPASTRQAVGRLGEFADTHL